MKERWVLLLGVAVSVSLLAAAIAIAQPLGSEGVEILGSERKVDSGGYAVSAQAGNVTQLIINATRISTHWQGYYGNVTGEIILRDSSESSLYSWTVANPEGEIYAANTTATIHWTNITCVNFSTTTTAQYKINQTTLDGQYGIISSEVDGFNDTFTTDFSGSIQVGDVVIDNTNNCPQTYLFVNNASQATDYSEILLYDNDSALVFTAILEPDGTIGYDGSPWDFQMLVAQDNSVVGNYYFYVELS